VHCVVVKARPPCVGGRDTWQTRSKDVAARFILLFFVFVVVILLLFVRSSVHSSPTFNSHEMNIDWQVPRVRVWVGMIAVVVVVVYDCCRHRVTTPVTVVRGVVNIMSPRNFPSSSACRLHSAAVAATTAEVVVYLCRSVSRA